MQLKIDHVDLEGPKVRAERTCTSPAFPAPMRGTDLVTIDGNGKITELEIRLHHQDEEQH